MSDTNPKLFSFFDQGKIKETIIGKNSFFIPDITFREHHDRLLVLRQLSSWAEKRQKFQDASLSIESAIDCLLIVGNLYEALDVTWCFLLVSDEGNFFLTIDMDKIQDKLSLAVKRSYNEISIDDELRDLVVLLAEKLPKFKYELDL